MSQTRLLQSEYAKKIRKAAINQVITDIVAARQGLGLEKKRLSKNQNYDAAILSLQEFCRR
jgi:parvulin-like peptidyl-prolyl isomerase